MRMIGLVGSFVVASAANAVALYDTLENQYTYGYGNCYGGRLLFGTDYDIRYFDDISIDSQFILTAITFRNVSFGLEDASQALLRIYRDDQGAPGTELTGPGGDRVTVIQEETFEPRFLRFAYGHNIYHGADVRTVEISYVLPAGRYWIGLQAVTGDWHYALNGDYGEGNDSWLWYDDGGYGTYWVQIGGDINMRVEGDVVPEPMTVIAIGGGLMAKIARRRRKRPYLATSQQEETK